MTSTENERGKRGLITGRSDLALPEALASRVESNRDVQRQYYKYINILMLMRYCSLDRGKIVEDDQAARRMRSP